MTSHSTIEILVHRIGRELAESYKGLGPSVFDRRWWSNTLLDWAMNDEAFKIRLFRFVDVLPSLKSDDQVAALTQEYFGQGRLPGAALQWGLRALSATTLGNRLGAKSLRHQIEQMAMTFIAGATSEMALPVLSRLWREGRAYSVDLLGEASVSEREADRYRDRCLDALAQLGKNGVSWGSDPLLECDHLGPIPRVNLSVKLSALYSQLDPIDPDGAYRAVSARLRPILDLAKSLPAAVTFDMEQAEFKDVTQMIFMRLLSEPDYRAYPYAALAVQAYLKETPQDLARVLQWAEHRESPIGIRLVKGAYWDSEMIRYQQRDWPVPVFQSKTETDAQYETLTTLLLRHTQQVRPAFGTHNLRSLVHAEAAAQAAGVPPNAYEFQMIYGMAEPLQAAVIRMRRRVRLYTPVGELIPGMAYLVRRLLENTSNESFLRKEYSQDMPLETLLAAPRVMESVSAPMSDNGGHRHGNRLDYFVNEPHTDFSHESARAAMRAAIADVKSRLGGTFSYPSASTASPSAATFSYNPSDAKQVVGRIPAYDALAIPEAMKSAVGKLAEWSARPATNRANILRKAAAVMRRRRYELAAWEIFETGKSWREADADVAEAIDFLEFYANEMERLARPARLGHEPGEFNQLVYAPRGVAAVIAPWNFPLAIPTGLVSAALVTGNVVLFKPSERATVIGLLLTDILLEAGVPEEALQVLPGGPEIGHALVSHPDTSLIAFTGSKDVGLRIIAQASHVQQGQRAVKHVIAEMGGKNAIIVDETADLDEAVTGVLSSFTGYQGQKCSACSRAIVHESIYELFLQRLTDAALSLQVGTPEEPGNRMGPMIDERALEKVQEYIAIGKREGRLVLERPIDGPGYFIGPTIFADIVPGHRLAQKEIFGPVLAVMKARNFEDALRMANDSPYALTGGLYSRSPANVLAAHTRFDVGNLYINRPITGALVGRQPFGGHRLSGLGTKAGGSDYLTQFMIARVVTENTLRRGFAPVETEDGIGS